MKHAALMALWCFLFSLVMAPVPATAFDPGDIQVPDDGSLTIDSPIVTPNSAILAGEGSTVTNNSSIRADRSGIMGGYNSVTVNNNGQLTSDKIDPGILETTSISLGDDAMVTNTGSVISEFGTVVSVGDNSTVINTASGELIAEDAVSKGFVMGGDATLTNAGEISIENAGSHGINLGSGDPDGDDTLTNSGTIFIGTVGNGGISFSSGDDTLTNSGEITIRETDANAIGMGSGADEFTNSGTITVQNAGCQAISMGYGRSDGDDTFTNSGTINIQKANCAGIVMAGGQDTFTNEAGGVINIGDTLSSAIGMGPGADSFTNAGTIDIQSANYYGIGFGSGDETGSSGNTNVDDTFTNSGTIAIDYAGNDGIFMGSDGDDTFTNSGTIDLGYMNCYGIRMGTDNDTFTNEAGGVITMGQVQDASGIEMDNGNDTLTNNGTIDIRYANNYGISLDSGHNTLTNTGDITIGNANDYDGIYMQGNTSLNNSAILLDNSGTIDISRAGNSGINMTGGLTHTLTNSDSISIGSAACAGIFMGGVSSDYNSANLLTNTGTIDVRFSNNSAIDMGDSFASSNTLDNQAGGTINSVYTAYDDAIRLEANSSNYNSTNLLTNAGTIDIGIANSNGILLESAATNTLTNDGTILVGGINDSAISLDTNKSSHSENKLTNTGTIDVAYANSSAILMESGVTQTLDNQAGAMIIVDSVSDYSAIDMQANSSYNSTNMLTNAGTIDVGHSCESGIVMESASLKNEFVNSGTYTMDSSLESGVEMDIDMDKQGLGENILTNTGTIDIGHANCSGIDMEGDSSYNSANLLSNSGTIDIEFACNGVDMDYSQLNTFDNSNNFRLGSAIGFGIGMDVDSSHDDSANTFINSGTVDIGYTNSNSIELEDGVTSTFTNKAGATITIGAAGDYTAIDISGNSGYNSTSLLTNAGTISIGYACNGIDMNYADSTLDNSGTITIENTPGYGISLDADGISYAQDNQLTNTGTIDIGLANSNGIELEGGRNNTLDNQAGATITISGSVDYNGIKSEGNYGDANKVTNTLSNAGTIDIGATCNGVVLYGGSNKLDNSGSLTVGPTMGYGIFMYGYDHYDYSRNDNILINSGTIDIENANDNLIYLAEGDTASVDNQAGATMMLGNALEGGGVIVQAYNTGTLTNAGTIDIGAVNSNGILVMGSNGDASLTNEATGSIAIESVADYTGLRVYSRNNNAGLTNAGTIDIGAVNSHALHVDADNGVGDTATLTNMAGGKISIDNSYYSGVYVEGYNTALINHGTIEVTNYVEDYGIYLGGGSSSAASNQLTNTGAITINIADDGGIYMSNAPSTLDNQAGGTITIEGTVDDGGIYMSDYDDTLTNTGVINISTACTGIELKKGNDVLTTSGALNFDALLYEALDGGSGNDTLNLQGTDMLTIDGDVINFEFLNKTGTGSWTIEGDVDGYNTAILGGTLIVNGDFDASTAGIYVASGATFGGNNNVTGNVVVDGIITPGNSIGTIYVDGDFTQNDGALYEVEVGSNEDSDLIEVTGTATIDDGALVDVSSVGYVADGDIFTILDASAGSLSGFYNSAGLSYSSIVLDYDYVDDSDDTVKLEATRTSYSDAGVDGTSAGIGDALIEMAENGDPTAQEILGQVDNLGSAGAVSDALGSLAPEMYPSLLDISMAGGAVFGSVVEGRMGNLHIAQGYQDMQYASTVMTPAGPVSSRLPAFERRAEGWSSWARVLGLSANQDSDGGLSGYELDTYGISLGVDNKVNQTCAVGLGIGLSNSSADFDDAGQSTDVDSYFVSLYGTHSNASYYIDASLLYASNDYDSDRQPFSGSKVSSSTDGSEWGVMLGGGFYLVDNDSMYFTPTLGLEYSSVDIDGFTESGGNPLALTVDSYDTTSVKSKLGFRWGGKMAKMEPELRLAWVHEFGDVDRDVKARFVNTTTKFDITAAEPDRDSALVGLGANFFVKDNLTLYVDYDGEFRGDYDAHALSGGLRYDF